MYVKKCSLSTTVLVVIWVITVLLLFYYETKIRDTLNKEYNLKTELFYKSQLEVNPVDDSNNVIVNLPDIYLTKKSLPKGFSKNCAKYPTLYDLQFNNIYWQTFASSNGTYYLYNAYYDDRLDKHNNGAVRIVGVIDMYYKKLPEIYCLLWYSGKNKPEVIQMTASYMWREGWTVGKKGEPEPYMFSCTVKDVKKLGIPVSVSVVEKKCDFPKNNLKVHNRKVKTKQDFAICVKGLDIVHVDMSIRMIEWIELMTLLGASKLHIYILQCHKNVLRVLKYYESIGKVTITPTTLSGNMPNLKNFQHLFLKNKVYTKRKTELIPYNDCFYRYRKEYEYIGLLDIDEVIMPTVSKTWKEMLFNFTETKLKKRITSYCFRNTYFMNEHLDLENRTLTKDIPKYLHMLQHIYRAEHFTVGRYAKCLHKTSKILTLHNHYPFSCIGGCSSFDFSELNGKLNHYRKGCVTDLAKHDCDDMKKNVTKDTKIWEYKDELMKRVAETINILNLRVEP